LEVIHETLYFLAIADKQGRDIRLIEQQFNTTLTDSYNQSVQTAHELKAQLKKKKLQFDTVEVKFVQQKSSKKYRKRPLDIDQDCYIVSGPSPKVTCTEIELEQKSKLQGYKIPLLTENREQKVRKTTSTESLGKFIIINYM
jgi:hypothetical protein